MLSYRHGFHAGNHADVLKHLVLVQLLDYLGAKDKSFWYVDTHAGAGRYPLHSGFAASRGESATGIARLWDADPLALGRPLLRYLELVRALNPGGSLRHYPGSPWLARACLRPRDRMWLHEMHPADYAVLEKSFRDSPVPASVADGDGFVALKSLLPPQPRRALIVIDPSYELKSDYSRLISALRDALSRFATGVYLVWYPMIARREAHDLPRRLEAVAGGKWLRVTLQPRSPGSEAGGLYGSGVFVINPPHTLRPALDSCMPRLRDLLAIDSGARFDLEAPPG
jgi:23S rRNA (adenine2030-N6)-methyltransferase